MERNTQLENEMKKTAESYGNTGERKKDSDGDYDKSPKNEKKDDKNDMDAD